MTCLDLHRFVRDAEGEEAIRPVAVTRPDVSKVAKHLKVNRDGIETRLRVILPVFD